MCQHFILFIILKPVGLEIRRGEVIAQKNHLALVVLKERLIKLLMINS